MHFVLFNTDERHYYHATDYMAETLEEASVYDSSVLAQRMADVLQEGNNRVEWLVVPVNDGYFDCLV